VQVRFWGTRGSIAKPGPSTIRYGGNTSCVEVRTDDGTVLVLDCGTGAHGLGQALVASTSGPIHGHLLITHTHWDHIQGFPFFAPLFEREGVWDLYAPGGMGLRLEAALSGQMEYTYFPVTLAQLGANIRFHDLTEGAFSIGDIRVTARYLNHPALTLGYRIEVGGATVVYATDHEPHSELVWRSAQKPSPGDSLQVHLEDRRHVEFLAGADLVIHDCQYTAEEYAEKIGWGHSPVDYAVEAATAAEAKRLALFHHDPLRSDEEIDRLVEACQRRAADSRWGLQVFAAAEGQTVILDETPSPALADDQQTQAPSYLTLPALKLSGQADSVLIVDDDPDIVRLLMLTLRTQGFRLISAADGEEALRVAREERPTLILLDRQLPKRDGLEVCRMLRADPDPSLRSVPIVLITAQTGSENIEAGFDAGATDYLTKPFTPAYVRTRVRGWILRRHAATGDKGASGES
jgi:CheY-like chemotaxis protein